MATRSGPSSTPKRLFGTTRQRTCGRLDMVASRAEKHGPVRAEAGNVRPAAGLLQTPAPPGFTRFSEANLIEWGTVPVRTTGRNRPWFPAEGPPGNPAAADEDDITPAWARPAGGNPAPAASPRSPDG